MFISVSVIGNCIRGKIFIVQPDSEPFMEHCIYKKYKHITLVVFRANTQTRPKTL